MAGRGIRALAAIHHPVAVEIDIPGLSELAELAERELRSRAATDRDRCCGYFPALEGIEGIDCDLPACKAFSKNFPILRHGGSEYRHCFLRLSSKQQSVDPAYHLDSDAATALGGDVTTLKERRVERLLLNLSPHCERTLHYLDLDSASVDLISEGSYVRVADPSGLAGRAVTATIRPRRGSHVAGLLFAANRVLHSGVDDLSGHFVAAYGIDEIERTIRYERAA